MFLIMIKNVSIKEDYINEKKKRKKEAFNYVSKGMLKLIISNIDFQTFFLHFLSAIFSN